MISLFIKLLVVLPLKVMSAGIKLLVLAFRAVLWLILLPLKLLF